MERARENDYLTLSLRYVHFYVINGGNKREKLIETEQHFNAMMFDLEQKHLKMTTGTKN